MIENKKTPATRKVFIKTWGCQMNVYDSLRMLDVVKPLGYTETEIIGDADLIIFNTCHIREKASEKLFSDLGRVRPLKEKREGSDNPLLIAVGGCVAQAEGAEIERRAPFVDLVFGPQTYHLLPELLARKSWEKNVILNIDFPTEAKFDYLPKEQNPKRNSAFLAIQEGCDKFCTYCVVPYTRGAEYSRSKAAVKEEAIALVDKGVREITLLGQNVNGWQHEGQSFASLISDLAKIEGLDRLRYMSSHPLNMTDALIALHRDEPKLMPFLHLPVQSGSDKILEAMNRKHKTDIYFEAVEKLRAARPDLALSSDFIVGFPGESDADFEDTLKLVRQVNYAQAFSFIYSKRPGTPAATLPNQIPEDVKEERLQALQELLRDQQTAFNENMLHKTTELLIENETQEEGILFGRTPYLQGVRVEGRVDLIGKIVKAQITEARQNGLSGKLLP